MIADILTAFVVALFLEMFALMNKFFKQMVILVCCICSMIVYFINGNQINFIGTVDFAVWIMLVVMFDVILSFVTWKLNNIKK